jgi:hypothetical protein
MVQSSFGWKRSCEVKPSAEGKRKSDVEPRFHDVGGPFHDRGVRIHDGKAHPSVMEVSKDDVCPLAPNVGQS